MEQFKELDRPRFGQAGGIQMMQRRNFTWAMLAGAALDAQSQTSAPQRNSALSKPQSQATSASVATARIGLALGAGSARGFAHIGVLKALDEAGLKADMIAGTSAGALVGVFYASGYTPWQIEEVALRVRDVDVADLSSGSKRGMLAGEALQKLVNDYVKQAPLERMKIPFAAMATQLKTGESVALKQGNAGAAVRASCAIPGVFVPAVVHGQELVDGGLISPLPVKTVRQMGADFVIAVDVGSKPINNTQSGLYEVLLQSFEIMGRSLSQLEGQSADHVIRPDTARFASTDFSSRRDLIQAGYEAGVQAVAEIKLKLGTKAKRKL
jgi:NTE family protein